MLRSTECKPTTSGRQFWGTTSLAGVVSDSVGHTRGRNWGSDLSDLSHLSGQVRGPVDLDRSWLDLGSRPVRLMDQLITRGCWGRRRDEHDSARFGAVEYLPSPPTDAVRSVVDQLTQPETADGCRWFGAVGQLIYPPDRMVIQLVKTWEEGGPVDQNRSGPWTSWHEKQGRRQRLPAGLVSQLISGVRWSS